MTQEKLIEKNDRFEKQKANEITDGLKLSAYNTQKVIDSLKTHLK